MAAPACSDEAAVVPNSWGEMGSAGWSCFSFRAPLGATVIRTGRVMVLLVVTVELTGSRECLVSTQYGGSNTPALQGLFCFSLCLPASATDSSRARLESGVAV